MRQKLIPKIVTVFKEGYTRQIFVKDLMSGVTVGIIALPLAIAFAIASGVKPEHGLYTAIVAGFFISAFGGSRVQIGGPTGAFIVVVFGIVQEFGYQGLLVATMMAGCILIFMGLARLGSVIKFIPYPMTIGFTSGIALIIFFSQLGDFFGLELPELKASLIDKGIAYGQYAHSLNIYSSCTGLLAVSIIVCLPKITTRIPGSIAAILATTFLVQWYDLPVTTIGGRFGDIPDTLPMPSLPVMTFPLFSKLIVPAFTIAILGAIESLLSAVVADGMTGKRHYSNMELVSQGIANILSPLFGGIPATGAIARTATNIKHGGTTPVSGMVHSLTLLLIVMFFGKWASFIPMPTLSAILLVVAYHMSEWRFFSKIFKSPASDIFIMLTTFFLTVFVDLTVAIEVGVVLSALLFMNRMANITEIRSVTRELNAESDSVDHYALGSRTVPDGVEIFEINGPFFFGAANAFKDTLSVIDKPPKVLILRMRHILTIDATAMNALEEICERTAGDGTTMIISGIHAQPVMALEKSGLYARIGENNIFGNIDEALNGARKILGISPVPMSAPLDKNVC